MIYYVLMSILILLETVALYSVLHSIGTHKLLWKPSLFVIGYFSMQLIAGIAIASNIESIFLKSIILIITNVIFSSLFFENIPLFTRVYLIITVYIFNLAIDLLASHAIILLGLDINSRLLYALFVIMVKLLYAITTYLLSKKYLSKLSLDLPGKWYLIILIMIMLINIMLILELLEYGETLLGMLAAFSLSLLNIIVYFLLDTVDRQQVSNHQNLMMEQLIDQQLSQTKNISDVYEQQKIYMHDNSKQLAVLTHLLQNGKLEDAQNHLKSLYDSSRQSVLQYNTGYTLMDAVLNTKYSESKSRNIDFIVTFNDLGQLVFAPHEIVAVMANLLDNAFEASEKCPPDKRKVKCGLNYTDGILYIGVENTYVHTLKVSNRGLLESTKKHYSVHGYGLQSIKRIFDTQGGHYNIQYKDGLFSFTGDIPILQ